MWKEQRTKMLGRTRTDRFQQLLLRLKRSRSRPSTSPTRGCSASTPCYHQSWVPGFCPFPVCDWVWSEALKFLLINFILLVVCNYLLIEFLSCSPNSPPYSFHRINLPLVVYGLGNNPVGFKTAKVAVFLLTTRAYVVRHNSERLPRSLKPFGTSRDFNLMPRRAQC